MAGKTLVFTVCTAEQYPFAQVLADSLPDTVTFKTGVVGEISAAHAQVVRLEQLPFEALGQAQKRYDATALTAASKPFFADYFLREEGFENVIYFDPTTRIIGEFGDILKKVDTADILLTPRLTRKFGKSAYGDEKMFLNTGMYDGGFWALRKTPNTFRFLKWWQQRLADRAYFDVCHAMNHDQLWLNYVPIFFENIFVNKNIGWNTGLQNLHERTITFQNRKWLVNQTEALVFFNFRECLTPEKDLKNVIQSSGGAILVKDYFEKLKKYSPTVPPIFSLRNALTPSVPIWKQELKKRLKAIVDTIAYFPIYHKISK